MTTRTDVDHYAAAMDHAGRYVWEEVRDALDAVRELLADGSYTDKEEALQSYADECRTVIYTGRAWVYCLWSGNDGAYREEMGEEPGSMEVRAMYALMADVREHPDWDDIGEEPEDDGDGA